MTARPLQQMATRMGLAFLLVTGSIAGTGLTVKPVAAATLTKTQILGYYQAIGNAHQKMRQAINANDFESMATRMVEALDNETKILEAYKSKLVSSRTTTEYTSQVVLENTFMLFKQYKNQLWATSKRDALAKSLSAYVQARETSYLDDKYGSFDAMSWVGSFLDLIAGTGIQLAVKPYSAQQKVQVLGTYADRKTDVFMDNTRTTPKVEPELIASKTLLMGAADIAKGVSATVKGSNTQMTFTRGARSVTVKVGDTKAVVKNGSKPMSSVTLGAPVKRKKNTLFVDVQPIVQALGGRVIVNPLINKVQFYVNGALGGKGAEYRKVVTKYGTHDYGSKTQAQYDAVMKVAEKAKAEYVKYLQSPIGVAYATKIREGVKAVLEGQRRINGSTVSGEGESIKVFIDKGYQLEDIVSILTKKDFTRTFVEDYRVATGGVESPPNTNPSDIYSAYDAVVGKRYDCDSQGRFEMAVGDVLGLNTFLSGGGSHAEAGLLFETDFYADFRSSGFSLNEYTLKAKNVSIDAYSNVTYGAKRILKVIDKYTN